MKKTILLLLIVLTVKSYSQWKDNSYVQDFIEDEGISFTLSYFAYPTYDFIKLNSPDYEGRIELTKTQLNKLLEYSHKGLSVSYKDLEKGNFDNPIQKETSNIKSLQETIEDFYNNEGNWNDNTHSVINKIFLDDEIGLYKILNYDKNYILYDEGSELDYCRFVCGYYNEDTGEYFCAYDLKDKNSYAVFANDEHCQINNQSKLINIPFSNKKIILNSLPQIIDFTSLIQETTNKISVVVCVCLGGFCCFLVVKKGLKWCRDYLGNSERQEKINNGWYEIEQGRFVPPVSDKIPSVVNDGGVWIDVLHDERYEGNMSIENYLEMRWANLYDKYVNESSRLVNTNKRVLDFNQFKALAESRKINASTVDDESFTRQIVDEQLKGSIDTEQKQRRNYKRKYYPRKQYFAIRNYYRRKRTIQTVVTQPVLLPPPVPQQTVVKPDESLTDDEFRQKYKSQLDDYIINKTPENKVYMDALMERHRKAHNISKTQWDNSPNEFSRKADEIERTIPIWEDTDTPF